jgi:hypothetical protein
MRQLRVLVVVALVWGAVQSCGDSTGPVAGVLKVVLASPNSGADGAILLTLSGPAPLTSATAGSGLRLFSQPLGATTRFAITGALTNGTVLTIGVPDIRQVASYTATVEQVAATSYQLRPLAGYALTVSR